MGVMWLDLGALTTARSREFWICWSRVIWDLGFGQVLIKRVAVVKLGVNNESGDGGSCFEIKVPSDTAKLTNMVIARFGDRWDLVRKGEVPIEYESAVSSSVWCWVRSCGLWQVVGTWLRSMSRNSLLEEFSVRRFAVIQLLYYIDVISASKLKSSVASLGLHYSCNGPIMHKRNRNPVGR